MMEVKAYCGSIELYPADTPAHNSLKGILGEIDRFNFVIQVDDPNVNSGQMRSNFDDQLEQVILSRGADRHEFDLPEDIPQQLDFAFRHEGNIIAVEVEKTNREKILRDVLKVHMYLHFGADFALLVLPKNYPHKKDVWNLYEFGKKRVCECRAYGFGTEERLDRIMLLGFVQFDAETRMPLDTNWRENVRQMAKGTQG